MLCEIPVTDINWRKQKNTSMKLAYPQVIVLNVMGWVFSASQRQVINTSWSKEQSGLASTSPSWSLLSIHIITDKFMSLLVTLTVGKSLPSYGNLQGRVHFMAERGLQGRQSLPTAIQCWSPLLPNNHTLLLSEFWTNWEVGSRVR